MQYFSLKFTYGKESKMKEKGDVPNLPHEFNPIIPLRDDSPQREFPIKALLPILREKQISLKRNGIRKWERCNCTLEKIRN